MSAIPFVSLDAPRYGEAVQVSPLVRRVIANNPSKYTYLGTGTYIIGHDDVAVIDPGPLLDEHRDALAAALPDGRAVALKIADGGNRARPPVMLAALRALGIDTSAVEPLVVELVLGHGHSVGEVRAIAP